jgi:PAS domain S-box-containing protein
VEVSIGPVHPIADSLRKTTARGYFVVGRIWDQTLLDDFALQAEAELSTSSMGAPDSDWVSDPAHGILRFVDSLRDWRGQPIALLRAEAFSRPMMLLNNTVTQRFWSLGTLALLLTLVWWQGMRRWVLAPLRKIAEALQSESVEPIEVLRNQDYEFGVVARLVKWYFDQRDELKNEIRDHLISEGTLQASLEHLESLSEELHLVLSNATDFIYRQDVYGNLTYLTPSVTEITGYTQDEFKKHYALLLTDHPMNAEVVKNTEYALQTGKAMPPYRAEIFHKDRKRMVIELSERPYFENGKVVGLIGVARDISNIVAHEEEKQRLTLQVQRAERMETLAMLAGGVAHDLNNTLGPLVAYPDLILSSLDENAEHRGEIEEMQRAAKQAAGIVQDLLSMARRGRYQMSPLNLNAMIEKYLQSANYREQTQLHPLVFIELSLDPKLPSVNGSSHHLYTALMNLVVNAFDAIPDGGTIRIITEANMSCPSKRQGIAPEHSFVRLRVSDTGCGIPADVVDRIFEPYFSTKIVGRSGSGLGLAVVHGIIADHNGFIEILSTVGEGTSFDIYLPLTEQIAELPPKEISHLNGHELVLVVDDLSDQRRVASTLLRGLGYKVQTASSLKEALSVATAYSIKGVVLDMLLDESYDGLDAHLQLREIHPNIPTVVVSGYVPTQRVQSILDTGQAAFVAKPFTYSELGSALRRVLDGVSEIERPALTS